ATVGNTFFDEVRIGTNWNEVMVCGGDTDTDLDGPQAFLTYIGTNYSAWNKDNTKTTITDGELADIANPVDIAVRWYDPSGVFVTNNPSSVQNIGADQGRVWPNWDPLSKGASTNAFGLDHIFDYAYGKNGDASVTTYQYSAFSITNLDFGNTYFITVSGEDNDSSGSCTENAPPAGGLPVPCSRAVTVNSQLLFTVTDDDIVPPTVDASSNLFLNPSFEQGFATDITYWNPWEHAYAVPRAAYAGTNGVEFTSPGWANIWQGIPGTPSNLYTLSYYVRKVSPVPDFDIVYLKIEFHDVDLPATNLITSYETNIVAALTTNWQLFTYSAVSVEGTKQVRGSIGAGEWHGGTLITTVQVDSVAIKQSPLPLSVRFGSHDALNVTFTNASALFTVTDGDLAGVNSTNDLRLAFRGYDNDGSDNSGLARGNNNGSENTNTFIHVPHMALANVTNFTPGMSSVHDGTLLEAASNVWSFINVPSTIIQSLMDGGLTNTVQITLRDYDHDRVDDQLSSSNILAGYLRVIDDDTNMPDLASFQVNGSTALTDGDLAAGFSLTGLVRDITSGVVSNSVAAGLDWAINYDILCTNGEILTDQIFSVAPARGGATSFEPLSVTVSIPYADRVLGPYTARVSVTDNDFDRTSDNIAALDSNVVAFTVTDDDAKWPRLYGVSVDGSMIDSTNLQAGDVAVVGFDSVNPDVMAFIFLVNVPSNTTIQFLDTTDGGATSGGSITYRTPSWGVPAGMVLQVTNCQAGAGTQGVWPEGWGTAAKAGSFDLASGTKDSILIRQATSNLYYARRDDASVPSGLSQAANTIAQHGSRTNGGFSATARAGSRSSLLAAITNTASWTYSINWMDQTLAPYSSAFSVSDTRLVTVALTDGQLAGGFAITGLVWDTDSGIYRVGGLANSPTMTIYNVAGSVVNERYFETGPTVDGSARLAASNLVASGISFAMSEGESFTGRLVVADFDDDRPTDILIVTQWIAFTSSDDDITDPVISNFVAMVNGPVAPLLSGANSSNVVYQITDGQFANAGTQPIRLSFNV
ncbi:MAG: hypothetical protein V2A34_02995, partial [Lentisphaerota bacterium]